LIGVPGHEFAIFSANQGWEPLCQFLGVDVPKKEFPNVNDREAIRKTIGRITIFAYLLIITAVIALGGIAFGLTWFLFR